VTTKQTFVLGIGCQKAGTTWLWDFLRAHDEVALALPKELHIFDTMLRPDLNLEFLYKAKAKQTSSSWKQRLKNWSSVLRPGYASPTQRLEMIANPKKYLDFFLKLDPKAKAVGEITPSYSTLDADHLKFIRNLLEPHFNLRIVLLLRDPVDRAYSGSKHLRRANLEACPVAFEKDSNAYFESIMTSPYITERQDYERLLLAVDQAFDADQVFVDFYERLFTNDVISALTDFLGIHASKPDFQKRVNEGAKASQLDPQLAARARETYASTYEFCGERFGHDLIDELWPRRQS